MPGEKLPTEAALAERFAVSRTVVREALSRLKSLGLIDSRQGSGVYVRHPSAPAALSVDVPWDDSRRAVVDMAEVRRALEAEAAALAAERRQADDLARLHAALAAIDGAVAMGHTGVDEDLAFHRGLAQAARNPVLLSTLDDLRRRLHGAIQVTRANEARRADFGRQVRGEHRAILQAIEQGDARAARRAAARHMDNAVRRLSRADPAFWEQQGVQLAHTLIEAAPAIARDPAPPPSKPPSKAIPP